MWRLRRLRKSRDSSNVLLDVSNVFPAVILRLVYLPILVTKKLELLDQMGFLLVLVAPKR